MRAFDSRAFSGFPAGVALLLALTLFLTLAGCGNVADKYKRNLAAGPPPPGLPTDPPPAEETLAAKIFSPSWARVGLEMELDASGSTGGAPEQLSYAWSLMSAPGGSSATILAPQDQVARFVPDVEGTYEFRLVVSRGAASSSAFSTTTVVPPANFISRAQTGIIEWTDFNANTLETIVLEHPVDIERTLFMMTVRAERTNPRFARYSPRYEFIDDRTIEIRTGSAPNDPMYVAWTVVEFTPEAVIGVERGTVDRGTAAGDQLDIVLDRPVDPRRSFVVPTLHQTQGVHEYSKEHAFTAKLVDDGVVLRLESQGRPDPGKTLSLWQVVEFTADSGVDVQAYELEIEPGIEVQDFPIAAISPRNVFLMSGGNSLGFTNSHFPVRQAFLAFFYDPETIRVIKNVGGTTKTDLRVLLYVVSVAGAEVYPYFGTFPGTSAFPNVQPSWPPIDRTTHDPVVMSGWNAFQFVWGREENTAHTDLMYTVVLNEAADGVEIERGLIESSRRQRSFSGFVVAWPKN